MTPVALFIYNRPETTARVFEAIRQTRPTTLLVIADGPRADKPGDAERCRAARAIVEAVDWVCDVRTLYAPVNLGIKQRVDSGLTWVFDQYEEAIIFEDDCLPHPDFFPFCQELLTRYRSNEQVMTISGNNFHFGRYQTPASYHFSRYPLIWGWATWRRAWSRYDPAMTDWPRRRQAGWLSDLLDNAAAVKYWTYVFHVNHTSLENWDYAWTFATWRHGGLSITPAVNLVNNIGFGPQATHTQSGESEFANLPVTPLSWPLRHPPRLERDVEADIITEDTTFSGRFYVKPLLAAARVAVRSGVARRSG